MEMKDWVLGAPSDLDGFSLSGDEKDLLFTKQLAFVGDFYKEADDLEFSVTEPMIDHWVKASLLFSQNGMEIPLPEEHSEEPGQKRGQVLSMHKAKDSKGRVALFGKVKFNDQEAAKQFKHSQTSVNVKKSITIPTTKQLVPLPITHVALTDYPVLPGMDKFDQLAASSIRLFDRSIFRKEDKMENLMLSLAKSVEVDVDDGEKEEDISKKILTKFEEFQGKQKELQDQIDDLTGKLKSAKETGKKEAETVVAASLVDQLRESREDKIDSLVRDGYINPAQCKEAKEQFATDEVVGLSLSSPASDGFKFWYNNIKQGEKRPLHGDVKSGPQADVLVLSGKDVMDSNKNFLLAEMESRSK